MNTPSSHSTLLSPIVLSTVAYEPMADAIASAITTEATRGFGRSTQAAQRGVIYRKSFPDGEHYLRLEDDVLGRDVVLVGGTINDSDTLEIYDLASAAVKYGARSLTLIVPYFGYATMERATQPGEVVTAKNRARLLSGVPNGNTPNRVFLLDVHTEGLPYYFEGDIVLTHIYAKPLILKRVLEISGGTDNLVLACTDAGRAKWVESLANDVGVPASFVFKRRLDGETTKVTAVSAQVEGKCVVVYDDMIRTGGSLMGAAEAYKAAGAAEIHAICTHGLFPGDSLKRLRESGLFRSVSATDSHPRARALGDDFLSILPTAALFAARIIR